MSLPRATGRTRTAGPPLPSVLLAVITLLAGALGLVHARLRRQLAAAERDPVTGLVLRVVAERYLTRAAGRPLTIAVVDGDGLHDINDRYGHLGGDRYLAAIADRLRRAAAPGDLVARLGGDEFLLATPRSPVVLQRALSAAVTGTVTIGADRVPLRLSVGICRSDGRHRRALELADRALYHAKRSGGGIAVASPNGA